MKFENLHKLPFILAALVGAFLLGLNIGRDQRGDSHPGYVSAKDVDTTHATNIWFISNQVVMVDGRVVTQTNRVVIELDGAQQQ